MSSVAAAYALPALAMAAQEASAYVSIRQLQGMNTVLCSVFRAPREYNGQEYSEYSGIRPNTAEYVSSRVLVGIHQYVFRF